jgi:pimeloyl-ACP methyl ester carboxylesterase
MILKRKLLIYILCAGILIFFSRCFMLNRFIYTDKELTQHYAGKAIKPSYHFLKYLNYNIHYAQISQSDTLPLLVLLHGAPGAWYGYMNLMDDSLLQSRYKIISIDRVGYGKSNYGRAELSTTLQGLIVKAVIDASNTSGKPITLLGRSYGAPIAAKYALYKPSIVAKLIMVSPVIDPKKEKFFWFSPIGKWKVVQWMLPSVLNVATKEKYAHPKEMAAMEKDWQKLYVPTIVLTGENDRIADTANLSFAKRHITKAPAQFVKLKNTGHLITYERPELIKHILLDQIVYPIP